MKNIVLILVLLFGTGSLFAQGKLTDEKRKEFEAQKVAFFTKELDLTPDEAAVFWPLYNEMRKKTDLVEMEMRKNFCEVKGAKDLKEQQYKEAVEKMLKNEDRIQTVKKEYYQKMLLVVPASKIWRLSEAERKFHRQLFDKLRRGAC